MRKLLAAAVITLGALALLGAGRGGTYQGGSYAGPGATYIAGSGRHSAAPVANDTVTVVFTTQPVLNAGAIDTSLVWGISPNTFAGTIVANDFVRRDLFTSRLAAADTVHILGTGNEVASFAYGTVDSSDANGYWQGSGYLMSIQSPLRVGAGPYTINRSYLEAERRAVLMYIPFEKYIPSGANVLDAYVNLNFTTTTTTLTAADSMIAVLDTIPGDTHWYGAKDVAGLDNYAHSAWQNQQSTNGGSWTGSNAHPWVPGITYGRHTINAWGPTQDETSTGNFSAKHGKDIKITNCVKRIVAGATNNGIVFNYGVKTDIWERALNLYGVDEYDQAKGRTPYFVVTYVIGTVAVDTSAPSDPADLMASEGDGYSSLTWTPSSDTGPVRYKVYRYFDGGDTTMVQDNIGNANYIDLTAINGSPHNYYVTAHDLSGNESGPTSSVKTYPRGLKSFVRPPYYAFWFQDPGTTIAQSTIDSLATFDGIVLGPFSMEGATSEPAYTGFLAALRAANPNIIVLAYAHPWQLRTDGQGGNRSPYKRMKSYCDAGTSGADSLGYACNVDGQIVRGAQYPLTRVVNFMRDGAADSVAFIWAEAYDKISRISAEYTGLFLDDVTLAPSYKVYPTVLSGTPTVGDLVIDADNDNTVFGSDADEKAAFQTYQINFIKALRREFAERGLKNRLIVTNNGFGKTGPTANTVAIMDLVDGHMIEGPNRWWPGNAAADSVWDRALGLRDLMTHTQIAPPMQMMQVHADSSAQHQAEVLALANDSWVGVVRGIYDDKYNNTHVPYLDRRLPVPGTISGYDIATGDRDTITATWSNYAAKIITQRNAGSPDSTFAVWPYVVYSDEDTLSISRYWERAGEEGAPPVPVVDSWTNGDREMFATLSLRSSQPYNWLPSDFASFEIAREYKDGPAYYDTFTVAVDTLGRVSENPTAGWMWYDTGLVNGREYKYKARSVDVLGNKSAFTAQVSRTPFDLTAPPPVDSVFAAGGSYFVDLDWLGVSASDLVGYYVARADDVNGAPGTFTARYDSVTISAYQDSTALSGQVYWYYVRAYDDDGNISASSNTVAGAWLGPAPVTYTPPSLIRTVSNYTPTSTAVIVYPPADPTGLTGYSIYRGPWNGIAATDTSACVLYKQNVAPDAFNGCVFEDTHANTSPDSAFQYTARALYSGNASDKYAPPVGAFTDGGFASQTPTCIAYGTGSAIAVAVSPVAGADSTRIYRGTSAGSQAFLAGVIATQNPYSDTSAAANTDYYYRVRQYDIQTAQWTNYSAVSGPVRWTSVPSGNPFISSVSDDTPAHGQAITLTGSNFGSRSATVDIYDLVNGGFSGEWTDSDYLAYVSTSEAIRSVNSTGAGFYDFGAPYETPTQRAAFRIQTAAPKWYASYWFKLGSNFDWGTTAFTTNSNWKLVRWFDNSAQFSPTDASYMGYSGNVCGYITEYLSCSSPNQCLTGCPGDYFWGGFTSDMTKNTWHHLEFEYEDSDVDQFNGTLRIWFDGVSKLNVSNLETRATGSTEYAYLFQLGPYNAAQDASTDPDDFYIDDATASTAWARVILGNNSSYSSCTVREVQPITTWASGSIEIMLNAGGFVADDTPYLFVVTEDGTVSAGKQVTISN